MLHCTPWDDDPGKDSTLVIAYITIVLSYTGKVCCRLSVYCHKCAAQVTMVTNVIFLYYIKALCEKLGYIYAILLLYIHYVHQQFQQQCILQTYLFISVG